MNWTRIPVPIDNEAGRRSVVVELAEAGLVVRIVRERKGTSKNAPFAKYIEYAKKEEAEE